MGPDSACSMYDVYGRWLWHERYVYTGLGAVVGRGGAHCCGVRAGGTDCFR